LLGRCSRVLNAPVNLFNFAPPQIGLRGILLHVPPRASSSVVGLIGFNGLSRRVPVFRTLFLSFLSVLHSRVQSLKHIVKTAYIPCRIPAQMAVSTVSAVY
jgi:hypothetical protein